MGFRFQKRIPLLKGVKLNLSKTGASVSLAKKVRRSISAKMASRAVQESQAQAFPIVKNFLHARWGSLLSG